MDSAIAYYKSVLHLEKTYDVFVHATSLDELKMVIEECVPTLVDADGARALVCLKFESCDIEMTRIVCESGIVCHLKKEAFYADLDAI